MIVCNWFPPILLLSLLPIVSAAPTPSTVKQKDNLGAEISDVLLVEETIIPPWGRYVRHVARFKTKPLLFRKNR